MISIEGLTVEFGGFTLLDKITYVINKKDRIALVGKNGAGKSTMLKIIAGLQQPSAGSVNMPKDITIGYLPQQMQLSDSRTVTEEAALAFSHIQEMQERLDQMNTELAERTDYESDSYQELIDRISQVSEQLALSGNGNYQAEIEKTLLGLGFLRSDFNRSTSEFSGGWRMRIELAKLLLQRPDVLLLDEPTNHLDIESIQWLEMFLSTRANAVVLVSHDRAFIDNVTNRTIEISLGHIYDYRVNYSKYVQLRAERLEQQQRAFENQQKQIQDTEGKSTLVKCIMGEIPYDGELKIGHNVKIGYFAQNQAQLLDESVTVFDTIDRVAVGDIRTKIRDILGAFMFGGEASEKKVKVLSGGEKTRLAMIRLLLEPVNLLILDEPTNHLDMRTKDVLKQALKDFDGTLIVVSHDREFLDGLVSKVYEFGQQKVREHLGGIYDFLAAKKMASLRELEVKSRSQDRSQIPAEKTSTSTVENKLSFEARKEWQRKLKRQERAVADTEQRLAKLDTEISAIEARLATPEGMADIDLCMKHGTLKKDAEALTELWVEQTDILEKMRKEVSVSEK